MIPLKSALSLSPLLANLRTGTTFSSHFSTTQARSAFYSAHSSTDYWSRKLRRMERIEELERQSREERRASERPSRNAYKKGPKLRGDRRDEEDVRISKTLSWLLRHGAKSEGLAVRPDGYARVRDLVSPPYLEYLTFLFLLSSPVFFFSDVLSGFLWVVSVTAFTRRELSNVGANCAA